MDNAFVVACVHKLTLDLADLSENQYDQHLLPSALPHPSHKQYEYYPTTELRKASITLPPGADARQILTHHGSTKNKQNPLISIGGRT